MTEDSDRKIDVFRFNPTLWRQAMHQVQPAMRRLTVKLQILSLTLLLMVACSVRAQLAGTGNIQGTISDATGAVLPSAAVTITEEATGVKHATVSNGEGVYVFSNLVIGTYSVSVTASGFQTYTRSGVVLEVGSSISVNIGMTVGRADQKIEVKAEGLSLQTEDPSFKQTIDEQDITEMPLNSNARQITGLITLSGGSAPAPAGDFTGSKYSYQTISVSIAGGNGNTTMWRLDGGDNNDYMANGNLPFPFPDAVNQFSVESTALSAQDGMHSGGMVNVVTRSGTNTYHGSAFEFIRNNYLDATNFFSTCTPVAPATTCTAKDSLHQNQFGGTFGGKILRDKLFGFAGYQRLQAKQSQNSVTAFVPTAANLTGDFSVTDGPTCTASKAFVQLVDPLTGATIPGDKYATPPTFNAQALALQKYLPATTDPCGAVKYAIPYQVTDNEFVTRVDYNINAKHNLYGRYFVDGYQFPAFFSPTNILITTQSGNTQRVQTGTVGENWTISARTVNSAHASILRRVNNRGYAANDINAATIGVNAFQAEPVGLYVVVTNKFTMGGGTNSLSHFNDNTLAISDDLTLVRGRHQIVLGGEWVQNQLNIANAYESNGNFAFSGTYSGSGPNSGTMVGDPDLDFLQGALNTFQQSKQEQNALRGPIPSLYLQDTFHASKQLTMVAGVRWSPQYMPVDAFNRGSVFSMSGFLSNQFSSVYPSAPPGDYFYGDKNYSVTRQFTHNTPMQFSPNVGLSYDLTGDGKTVIRAGVGMVYDQVNFFTGQRVTQNPPYATAISETQTATSGPLSFSNPWSVGSITANPFPQPTKPTPAQAVFYPQSQYIYLPNRFHPSYTVQWTISVQHQFSHGWEAQLDYIGNHTAYMPIGLPLSPAVFTPGVWADVLPLPTLPTLPTLNTSSCGAIAQNGAAAVTPVVGANCSTVANENSRFFLTEANANWGNQYAGGGGGSVLVSDTADANYEGMVATIQHRLSSSFSLLANYTYSKCLNIEDGQGDYASTTVENPNNPRLDYGPCGSDYRNVENIVLISKSNFKLSNRAESLLLNGWEFAPLAHVLSGAPFTVTAGADKSYTDVGNDRPNKVAGVASIAHIANRSGTGEANREYLNPAAFAQVDAACAMPVVATACAAYGAYGNIGRNTYRGLPNYQFDAQVSRIFPIHERLNATLRLEAFNVLNHPNLATPTANLSSLSTFGQISALATNANARLFQGSIKFGF
jgi:Carboxypeptidase regulatory-like domain